MTVMFCTGHGDEPCPEEWRARMLPKYNCRLGSDGLCNPYLGRQSYCRLAWVSDWRAGLDGDIGGIW